MYTDGFAIFGEDDLVKILFAEKSAVVVLQAEDDRRGSVEKSSTMPHCVTSRGFAVGRPSADDFAQRQRAHD